MKVNEIHPAIRILRREVSKWQTPIVTVVAQSSESPFHVLISCILSLRTQDATTAQASRRLFALAGTPAEMRRLFNRKIEKAIYAVGVPDKIDELLKLKGVGRKTANLVVTLGYRKPGICVDTHVHRISNRWGYLKTATPEKTECARRENLPQQYWIEYNDLLVSFGQQLCRPISPLCSQCPVSRYCARKGVA